MTERLQQEENDEEPLRPHEEHQPKREEEPTKVEEQQQEEEEPVDHEVKTTMTTASSSTFQNNASTNSLVDLDNNDEDNSTTSSLNTNGGNNLLQQFQQRSQSFLRDLVCLPFEEETSASPISLNEEFQKHKERLEAERAVKTHPPSIVHFIFLVHGHRGLSKDLHYMQHMMQEQADGIKREKRKNRKKNHEQQQNASSGNDADIVIHNVTCNEGKTTDGIQNGGIRLVEEILNVIDTEMQSRYSNHNPSSSSAKSTNDDEVTTSTNDAIHKSTNDAIDKATVPATSKDDNAALPPTSEGGDNQTPSEPSEESANGSDTAAATGTTVSFNPTTKDEATINNNDDDEETSNSGERYFDISISFLGNSLGGLYVRYAIGELISEHCTNSSATKGFDKGPAEEKEAQKDTEIGDKTNTNNVVAWVLDEKYRLYLNHFVTTATPHIGVSHHTYMKIPRLAEQLLARVMGQVGQDLFCTNGVMETLCTDPKFIVPLSKFHKRIAYANVYGTDFPVPPCTAAFLSEKSTSLHYYSDFGVAEKGVNSSSAGDYVIATLYTRRQQQRQQLLYQGSPTKSNVLAKGESSSSSHATVASTPRSSISGYDLKDSDDPVDSDSRSDNNDINVPDPTVDPSCAVSSSSNEWGARQHDEASNGANGGDGSKAQAGDDGEQNENDDEHHTHDEEQIHQMTLALDNLGWKKVFVDMRQAVPSVEIPSVVSTISSFMKGKPQGPTEQQPLPEKQERPNLQALLKQKSYNADNSNPSKTLIADALVVESRHVASSISEVSSLQILPVTSPDDEDSISKKKNRIAIPFGHNAMIALSRNPMTRYVDKGGRPFVDALAKEFIDDVSNFEATKNQQMNT